MGSTFWELKQLGGGKKRGLGGRDTPGIGTLDKKKIHVYEGIGRVSSILDGN